MKVKNEYTVLPVYPIYVFSNLFHYWRNKVFNCIAQLGMVDNKMYRWCFCFCYHSPLSLMNQYLQIMKSGSCTYPQYVIRIFSGKSLRITHVRPVFLFTVWKIGFTKNPGKIQSRWIFAELFRCQSRDFVFKRFRRKNGSSLIVYNGNVDRMPRRLPDFLVSAIRKVFSSASRSLR